MKKIKGRKSCLGSFFAAQSLKSADFNRSAPSHSARRPPAAPPAPQRLFGFFYSSGFLTTTTERHSEIGMHGQTHFIELLTRHIRMFSFIQPRIDCSKLFSCIKLCNKDAVGRFSERLVTAHGYTVRCRGPILMNF